MGVLVGDFCLYLCVFFFQAEDGIRDLVRSRGLGDVYKRQAGILMTWNYWRRAPPTPTRPQQR